jgi:hypothetical protein
VAVGRDQRRAARRTQLRATFDEASIDPALDVLDLMDLAWHDCFDEVAPPAGVLDDVLVLSDGEVEAPVRHALAAIVDYRDVRIAADEKRRGGG